MPPGADVPPLEIGAREIGVGALLTVCGELSLRTVPQLQRAVEKQLGDRGRVLVDVSGMAVSWRPALELFVTAQASMTGWPAARLVLFGARGELAGMLARAHQLTASVHVAATRAEAVQLLGVRPRRLTRRAELPCGPEAAKWARLLVDAVFADWEVPDIDAHSVRMVVSELVSNAVLHARTSSAVTLTLSDWGMRVAVRDYLFGRGPQRVDAQPSADGRLGMVLVGGVARSWGVTEHDDGKTVWAVITRHHVGPVPPAEH